MKKLLFSLILLLSIAVYAATVKISYRATNTAMTITSVASLATTANLIGCSASVDNSTNLDLDEIIHPFIKTNASGTSASGLVSVYVYGCTGAAAGCDDTVAGTDSTVTMTNPTNLVKAETINAVANSTVYNGASFSLANQFGGVEPSHWGVCFGNSTGAALFASGSGVNYDSVQAVSQ